MPVHRRSYGPTPSIAEPRPALLEAVREFVRAAGGIEGVLGIALVGSLATNNAIPKDADVIVTIDAAMDLAGLARAGRRLKGRAQNINLGADIFLADRDGRYLGPISNNREAHPRVVARPRHCGDRQHLTDDLDVVTLSKELIAAPLVELWPSIVRRCAVPPDVETLLLAGLDHEQGITR
jgi:hypothetical protein